LINQFLVELDGIDSNNDGVLEMTIIEDIQGLMDYEDLVILHNLINKPMSNTSISLEAMTC